MTNGVVQGGLQHLFEFLRQVAGRARAHGEQTIESYILALSTLDAMCFAKTGEYASGDAFSDLVIQYSGRANIYTKVAVPILFEELRLTKPRSYGAVLECLRQEYALDEHFENKRIRVIDEDPDWNTFWGRVSARCVPIPPNTEQEFRRFTYTQLLWRHYRTYAVHRLTVRDEAANIAGNVEPYYMNEQAKFAEFDCGRVGFSCVVKRLMLYGDLGNLAPEIVVEEVTKAIGKPAAMVRPSTHRKK